MNESMPHHEYTYCPRCQKEFECKVGNILECQCSQVQLTYEERIYIEHKYADCLCKDCLQALQQEYDFLRKQHFKF